MIFLNLLFYETNGCKSLTIAHVRAHYTDVFTAYYKPPKFHPFPEQIVHVVSA